MSTHLKVSSPIPIGNSMQQADLSTNSLYDKQNTTRKDAKAQIDARRLNIQRKSSIADLIARLTTPTTASKNRMRVNPKNEQKRTNSDRLNGQRINISQPISSPVSSPTNSNYANRATRRVPPTPPSHSESTFPGSSMSYEKPNASDAANRYNRRNFSGPPTSGPTSGSSPTVLKSPTSGVSRGMTLTKRAASGPQATSSSPTISAPASARNNARNRNSSSSTTVPISASKKQDVNSTPELTFHGRQNSSILSPDRLRRQPTNGSSFSQSSVSSPSQSIETVSTVNSIHAPSNGCVNGSGSGHYASTSIDDRRSCRISSSTLGSIVEIQTEEDLSKPCTIVEVPSTPAALTCASTPNTTPITMAPSPLTPGLLTPSLGMTPVMTPVLSTPVSVYPSLPSAPSLPSLPSLPNSSSASSASNVSGFSNSGRISNNVETLQAEVRELRELLNQTSLTKSQLSSENVSLKDQLLACRSSEEAIQLKLTDLYTKMDQSKRTVRSLESTLQDYKLTLEEKKIENYELQRKLKKMQSEKDHIQEQNDQQQQFDQFELELQVEMQNNKTPQKQQSKISGNARKYDIEPKIVPLTPPSSDRESVISWSTNTPKL